MSRKRAKKPAWLKVDIPGGSRYRGVRETVSRLALHTVCQEARCPNLGECWDQGTATFLILGDVCSRGCSFCAVRRGAPGGVVDRAEPERIADAARQMALDYVVITSVTRDDLSDSGASMFVDTLHAVRALESKPRVELLIPDFRGRDLDVVLDARPDVLAHNLEVVERLTPALRHERFAYRSSLEVLARAAADGKTITKSSLMVGLSETEDEVHRTMRDLRQVGVRILVLGQYLQPTRGHAEVIEYVSPERFNTWADEGKQLGFDFVAASPLARTSHRAAQAYAEYRAAQGVDPRGSAKFGDQRKPASGQ